MNIIQFAHHDHVAVIKLSRGVINAIDLQMVTELSAVLREIKEDPNTIGLVLTSANEKFFSIGLDIPGLFPLSREEFTVFYKAFNRLCIDLFTLPRPTVAAITGHATAGGCILTLCCDYRFLAQGKKLVGLNEVKLGVPVPYPADCILRNSVGGRFARDIMYFGEFFEGRELLQMGLVDEILPPGELIPRAIATAGAVEPSSLEAFAMIKANRVERVKTNILAHLEQKEQYFVARWYAPQTRQRLKAAMEKFKTKK
jgi:enoyl-CoA hydratase/carnithine racemase